MLDARWLRLQSQALAAAQQKPVTKNQPADEVKSSAAAAQENPVTKNQPADNVKSSAAASGQPRTVDTQTHPVYGKTTAKSDGGKPQGAINSAPPTDIPMVTVTRITRQLF